MDFHTLRVAHVERLCADAAAVTFDVPEGLRDHYRFRAGQSLTVRRGDDRRSYSICAPVGERPRIGVREVPGGAVSAWLVRGLRAGDPVEVAPPTGTFTPDLAAAARHVLIAAGSGITPMVSIAASLLRLPETQISLWYGNRRTDTVMFAEELAELKDSYPSRLELVHLLSREAREAELLTGRLDGPKLRTLIGLLIDVKGVDHWWLCGPFGMVTDAAGVLAELGVDPAAIHRELFWVDAPPPEPARPTDAVSEGSAVTIMLDGRATEVVVPPGATVLEGAQLVRPDLPFACKGGVCGTCRARVTHGEVRMRRNFALDPAEVTAGYVLTCQSVPQTPELRVDFDS